MIVRAAAVAALIGLVVAAGCEGPVGPPGPMGEPGLQGGQGPQGPQGEPGTANVMFSDWLDVEIDEAASSPSLWRMLVGDTRVTGDFLRDGGLVLMFLKLEAGGTIVLLPLPWLNVTIYHNFMPVADPAGNLIPGGFHGIIYTVQSMDASTIPSNYLPNAQLRYFLIPGGTELPGPGTFALDPRDYGQITRALGIDP